MFPWFKRKSSTDQFLKELKETRKDVMNFITMYGKHQRYCSVRNGPCSTQGFFFWEKDEKHLYKFANFQHCTEFFGLPSECTENIIGMSDIDLVSTYMERTGMDHSFGELCVGTDNIIKERKISTRFIEIGYVGGNLFVLDVVKHPLYNENSQFAGSYGVAMNVADQSIQVRHMLEIGIKEKHIDVVEVGKSAAVYMFKECSCKDVFKDGFPNACET